MGYVDRLSHVDVLEGYFKVLALDVGGKVESNELVNFVYGQGIGGGVMNDEVSGERTGPL